MKISQANKILNHLKEKPITPMEAFKAYGITRVAARILDLRLEGHNIETRRIKSKDGGRYAEYRLLK